MLVMRDTGGRFQSVVCHIFLENEGESVQSVVRKALPVCDIILGGIWPYVRSVHDLTSTKSEDKEAVISTVSKLGLKQAEVIKICVSKFVCCGDLK